MKNGRPNFYPSLAFSVKAEEFLIATVKVNDSITGSALRASIWCVKGFLFSVEYDIAAKYFGETVDLKEGKNLLAMYQLSKGVANSRSDKN